MDNALVGYLFETMAIRVCPKDKPFWYTSGKIGPYYINTHFLYGSGAKANSFLEEIDELKADKLACSKEFYKSIKENYDSNSVFKGTIDSLVDFIKSNFDVAEIEYISGGERRDWFFSFMVADILNKPHITLFKDLSSIVWCDGKSSIAKNLNGASILHVADLITTASSYERAWVPAIEQINGKMKWSVVVVDRLQGGGAVLRRLGVQSYALVNIDIDVFVRACRNGYINESQLELVLDYIEDPEEFMETFLKEHTSFLEEAIAGEDKIAERAKLLIQQRGSIEAE